MYVLGVQKDRLIEKVLLSTHNIYVLVEKQENYIFGTCFCTHS